MTFHAHYIYSAWESHEMSTYLQSQFFENRFEVNNHIIEIKQVLKSIITLSKLSRCCFVVRWRKWNFWFFKKIRILNLKNRFSLRFIEKCMNISEMILSNIRFPCVGGVALFSSSVFSNDGLGVVVTWRRAREKIGFLKWRISSWFIFSKRMWLPSLLRPESFEV